MLLQFLPNLKEPELRKDLIENGLRWKERFLLVFKYHGLSETITEAIKNLLTNTKSSTWKTKGYAGQDLPWSTEFAEFKKNYSHYDISFDPEMITRLEKMIAYCDSENIQVIITHLPLFDEATAMMTEKYRIDSLMHAFEKTYPVCHYWDYSKTSFSNDTNYFYDATRMNYRGADSISRTLARRIKEELIH